MSIKHFMIPCNILIVCRIFMSMSQLPVIEFYKKLNRCNPTAENFPQSILFTKAKTMLLRTDNLPYK